MEKRRIRLEINGVVCGLITQESDEYMASLAEEVGEMMNKIMASSPFITKESAAVTAALNYVDTAKKAELRENEKKRKLEEIERRNLELERLMAQLKKENNRLSDETAALADRIDSGVNSETRVKLENKIADLEIKLAQVEKVKNEQSSDSSEIFTAPVKLKNPLRHHEIEESSFTSFFERKDERKN